MLFIEAPIFTKHIYDYLNDEEYSALQQTIALRPDVGKVIPGSGGLRKLRWAGSGRGKRGGGFASFIIGYEKTDKYGCLLYMPRMKLRIFPAQYLKCCVRR